MVNYPRIQCSCPGRPGRHFTVLRIVYIVQGSSGVLTVSIYSTQRSIYVLYTNLQYVTRWVYILYYSCITSLQYSDCMYCIVLLYCAVWLSTYCHIIVSESALVVTVTAPVYSTPALYIYFLQALEHPHLVNTWHSPLCILIRLEK
jgi:hypothetical protein